MKTIELLSKESLREGIMGKLEQLVIQFKQKDDPDMANLIEKYRAEIEAL